MEMLFYNERRLFCAEMKLFGEIGKVYILVVIVVEYNVYNLFVIEARQRLSVRQGNRRAFGCLVYYCEYNENKELFASVFFLKTRLVQNVVQFGYKRSDRFLKGKGLYGV